eukprot:m.207200 g.207200  ORF g.207200 m.207200 type:complete len:158 (+) comp18922_c0_seq1:255-728(+)
MAADVVAAGHGAVFALRGPGVAGIGKARVHPVDDKTPVGRGPVRSFKFDVRAIVPSPTIEHLLADDVLDGVRQGGYLVHDVLCARYGASSSAHSHMIPYFVSLRSGGTYATRQLSRSSDRSTELSSPTPFGRVPVCALGSVFVTGTLNVSSSTRGAL